MITSQPQSGSPLAGDIAGLLSGEILNQHYRDSLHAAAGGQNGSGAGAGGAGSGSGAGGGEANTKAKTCKPTRNPCCKNV